MVEKKKLNAVFLAFLILLTPFSRSVATGEDNTARDGVLLFSPSIIIHCRVVADAQGNILSVVIPLKRAGRLLLFEASIDGQIGNFILDTGSTGLVLNQTYFRDYVTIDRVDAGGITGSTAPAGRIRIKRLQVSDMVYENLFADVTNLGHIENRRGVKVYGLFGMNLMKNMEIMIDVRNNVLQLHRLDKEGNRLDKSSRPSKFDVSGYVCEHNNMACVSVVIAEKTLDFCIDTGAESNVLDVNLPKKVLSTVAITRRSTLQGTGSGTSEVFYGNMSECSIGGQSIGEMQALITNLAGLSEKYGYTINGMLGYDFFEKGKIYINLVKKELGVILNKDQAQ
jgi:predicted aspartyl protease